MKKRLPITHWTVRAISVCQVFGALTGIIRGLFAMWASDQGNTLPNAVIILLYLATGIAATALWFEEEPGLQWMRWLVALQIPFVQSVHNGYLFFAGATGIVYGGSRFGIQTFIGAGCEIRLRSPAPFTLPFAIGVNALALTMFVVISHVDLGLSLWPSTSSAIPPTTGE